MRWRRLFRRRARVVPVFLRRIDPAASPAAFLRSVYRDHRKAMLEPLQVGSPRGAMRRQYRAYRGPKGAWTWFFGDVLGGSLKMLVANGRHVRAKTGKPLWRQWLEMVWLALCVPAMPEQYYRFEWYLPGFRARAGDYLQRYELKNVLYKMLDHDRRLPPVTDKARFYEHARAAGLPVVPTIAVIARRRVRLADGVDVGAIDHDLFVKPVAGKGGRGTDRLIFVGGRRRVFRSTLTGRRASLERVLRRYATRSRRGRRGAGVLVQPRVFSHRALWPLAGKAAVTCRVVTILDEEGAPEVVAAVLRMPGSLTGVVDNIHAGGIAAPIALEDGVLGEAADLGVAGGPGHIRARPDNGAPIAGTRVPEWDAVRRLCVEAHRAFAPRVLVGWDVCVTDDGPVLIEANAQPCTDLMQRAMRAPLGRSRFAELLAWHVRRYLVTQ